MFHIPLQVFRTHPIVVGGAMFCALLVIVGIAALGTSGATPAATPTRLPDSLTNPKYPFATDALIEPTHVAFLQRSATERVQAATRYGNSTRDPNTPTPLATIDHPISRTGIIAGPLPLEDNFPFRRDATIENFYRAFPQSNMFVVAAGAASNDPLQGFVGVASSQKTGLAALNKSLTPTKHGSVHITAVNGSLVTLVAADGTMFIFDDKTYTFQ